MEIVKKNLAYVCCAVVGLLNFLWMLIDYVSWEVIGLNGFDLMSDMFDYADFEVTGALFSGIMGIVSLIAGIVVLAYGVCGLLKAFGIFKAFPDQIAGICTKKIAEYVLIAFAAIQLLLFVALIIFCVADDNPFKLSAGIIISLIVALAAAAAPIAAEKLIKE